MSPEELIRKAAEAADNAYAPFSGYNVGAAVLTRDGKVFTGCNVENSSFGLTNCAERTAIFSAIAAGHRDFTAIAIVAPGGQPPYPCGACRQVMNEFCGPDLKIHVAGASQLDKPETTTLGNMLPKSFRLDAES